LHVSGTDDLTLRPREHITILRSEAARRAHDEVQKFWYNGPVFRRSGDVEHYQIHQFGFEIWATAPLLPTWRIMKVAMRICRMLGLRHPHIELTSYGCHECRPAYLERMRNTCTSAAGELPQLRRSHAVQSGQALSRLRQ
jgi:histidyl-tRNA synthetase